MCLSATIWPLKQQPTIQAVGELLAGVEGKLERIFLMGWEIVSTAWVEGFKGQMLQLFEVTETELSLADSVAHLSLTAGADLQAPELWMVHGDIDP